MCVCLCECVFVCVCVCVCVCTNNLRDPVSLPSCLCGEITGKIVYL